MVIMYGVFSEDAVKDWDSVDDLLGTACYSDTNSPIYYTDEATAREKASKWARMYNMPYYVLAFEFIPTMTTKFTPETTIRTTNNFILF